MRLRVILILALAVAPVLAQLPPPQGPPITRLRGRVTAADGAEPVRNALVVITSVSGVGRAGGAGGTTSTDAEGRWEYRTVFGRYAIRITKAGFVSQMYGQRRPFEPGKTVDLDQGQSLDKLDIALTKSGAISGRVSDEFGEPMSNMFVTALRYRYVDGVRQLQTVPGASLLSSLEYGGLVDERGEFRIYGLPPGNYYVGTDGAGYGAGAPGARAAYVRTFYPGTAFPTGTVAVSAGRETSGIDFRPIRSPVASVQGHVIDSFGNPITMGSILLLPPDARSGDLVEYQASVRSDGSFTLADVPSGDYRLHVEQHTGRGAGPQIPELGSLPISVNGRDLTDVAVQTLPSATASGRVIFEDSVARPGTTLIVAYPIAPAVVRTARPGGSTQPDGTFSFSGLVGRWLLRVRPLPATGGSPAWFLKSVTLNGQNITDSGHDFLPGQSVSGLEILYTTRTSGFQGVVRDEKGNTVDDAAVVAFAADPRRLGVASRYVGRATVDNGGKFLLPGLPDDDYYVIALAYSEPGEETDLAQLEAWRPRAIRASVGPAETKSLALTLVR